MKKIIVIFISILLTNCGGYKPIYSSKGFRQTRKNAIMDLPPSRLREWDATGGQRVKTPPALLI